MITQVMEMPLTVLETCPALLTRSLSNSFGPRWTYVQLHCKGQAIRLSSRLGCSGLAFVSMFSSSSIRAECESLTLTPLQHYLEFKLQWQQGEGGVWCSG